MRRQLQKPPWILYASRLALLLSLILIFALLSAAVPASQSRSSPRGTSAGVLRRRDFDESFDNTLLFKKHKKEPEDPSNGSQQISLLPYMAWYDELQTTGARVAGFSGLVLWLVFLFGAVGLTASDYLCPNLATLSSRLGLSEAVAGSTLLAFGNGSPDVFSTFAALRSNSGSLAVGELLGAAAFIVSFVAGSMTLMGDFKVAKHAFLRDVGFFAVAILLFAVILIDGKIARTEAGALVILYLFYVAAVTIGSWWHQRKMRQKEMMRKIRAEYGEDEPYRDDPTSPYLAPSMHTRTPSQVTTTLYSPNVSDGDDQSDDDEILDLADSSATFTVQRMGRRARSATVSSQRPMARSSVRPSLLSAVEFRDVVNSLRAESADERTLGVFQAAAGGHRRAVSATFPRQRQVSLSPGGHGSPGARSPSGSERARKSYFGTPPAIATRDEQRDLFARQFGDAADRREERVGPAPLIDLSTGERNPWGETPSSKQDRPQIRLAIPDHLQGDACEWIDSPSQMLQQPAFIKTAPPAIVVTHTSPGIDPDLSGETAVSEPSKRFAHTRQVFATLFPSLQGITSKSFLGIFISLISVPALLVLTLTLPVVDEEMEGSEGDSVKEKGEDEEEAEQARRRDEHIAHRLHTHESPSPRSFDPSLVDASLVHLKDALPHGVPEHAIVSPRGTPTSGVPSLHDHAQADKEQVRISHILAVVQCAIAPWFTLASIFAGEALPWWYFVIAAGASIVLGAAAYAIERSGRGRLALCFVGFTVAVLWIMSIVNEVVGVLQAFGYIFGLSDALIGLTIFAVGNSIGDLVANTTIMKLGYPVMGLAACYGGPMLNILRVGLSGTYFVASTGKPYHIRYSFSLMTTSAAVLIFLAVTLIVVPSNGYVMTRKFGICMMGAYVVLLAVNVIIELVIEERSLS